MTVKKMLATALVMGTMAFVGMAPAQAEQPARNPCAKNPCAVKMDGGAKNPCAVHTDGGAKNPCAPKNPCAVKRGVARELDPGLITRPAGTRLATGDQVQLVKEGERLWKDTKLSSNGMSCDTCHNDHGAFMPGFAKPYPHEVEMIREKSGVARIHLDEMVQGCLVMPMAANPLPWDSRELAALTAYTAEVQKTFKPNAAAPANPCAPKNPCGAKQ
ncbi:MAG: cytochrome C peroxidase [Magnetococcales bacterium]|nr:cytochrome C peroxidase [Magnetococcales bacterium]